MTLKVVNGMVGYGEDLARYYEHFLPVDLPHITRVTIINGKNTRKPKSRKAKSRKAKSRTTRKNKGGGMSPEDKDKLLELVKKMKELEVRLKKADARVDARAKQNKLIKKVEEILSEPDKVLGEADPNAEIPDDEEHAAVLRHADGLVEELIKEIEQVAGKKKRKTHRGKKWTRKYKRSINCKNPKGFSQKQYCKYGKKLFSK